MPRKALAMPSEDATAPEALVRPELRGARSTEGAGSSRASLPRVARRAQQSYPAGLTVKFVVGFPAGGAQDIVARIVADRLGNLWKRRRGGERRRRGRQSRHGPRRQGADRRHADLHHTAGAGDQSIPVRAPRLRSGEGHCPARHVASVPNLLCVRKDLPVKSVAELVAYAKANPGKLNYASSGIGTTVHLSAELFKRMAGIDMVHVAYRGSAPALNDLVGQNVDLMFDNITSIIGQARAGAVKPLGVTTLKRHARARIRACCRYLPGYDTTSWTGVGVRAGTPKEICDKIEADTRAICQDPLLKERLAGLVAETVGTERGRNHRLHRRRARQVGQADHRHQAARGMTSTHRKKP